MNKAAKKYYKDVYHTFPTHSQPQNNYLIKFYDFLDNYSQHHPQEEYLDYIENFGEPQDIVASYYERIDNQSVISHMKLGHIVKYNLIIFCSLFLIIFSCFVYLKYREYVTFYNEQTHYYEIYTEPEV